MRPTGTPARDATSVLLLIAVAGVVVAGGAPSEPAGGGSGGPVAGVAVGDAAVTTNGSFAQFATVEEFDDVQLHIHMAPDRSATWSVKYRYRLGDNETERAFERTRQNVTNPPGVFIERMRNAARRAAMRTGREMAVQNGSVSAFRSVPHGRFGVVEYRFTWTGFAASDDDGDVVVGDTLSGYPLAGNESLIFSWDDQFQVADVAPEPNATAESTVRWDGPHDFVVENPTLVLTSGSQSALPPLTMVVGGLLTVAVVVVLVYGLGAGGVIAALTSRGDGEEEKPKEPPAELLSDEERVLQLVEENGGRMKQQEVKDALDWSRTKTSNVVNDLQEADKLEVYRLGRENTLALPGEIDV